MPRLPGGSRYTELELRQASFGVQGLWSKRLRKRDGIPSLTRIKTGHTIGQAFWGQFLAGVRFLPRDFLSQLSRSVVPYLASRIPQPSPCTDVMPHKGTAATAELSNNGSVAGTVLGYCRCRHGMADVEVHGRQPSLPAACNVQLVRIPNMHCGAVSLANCHTDLNSGTAPKS